MIEVKKNYREKELQPGSIVKRLIVVTKVYILTEQKRKTKKYEKKTLTNLRLNKPLKTPTENDFQIK